MFKHYLPVLSILFILALIVGVFAFYRSLTTPPKTPPIIALASPVLSATPSISPVLGTLTASPSALPKISLTIFSPLENASVSSSLLPVRGHTATDAAVLVNDKPILVDSIGNFTSSYRLTSGPNLIVIEASASSGSSVWQTVVTYTPKETPTPAPTQNYAN